MNEFKNSVIVNIYELPALVLAHNTHNFPIFIVKR